MLGGTLLSFVDEVLYLLFYTLLSTIIKLI